MSLALRLHYGLLMSAAITHSGAALTPRLEIYPERITENAAVVLAQCQERGVEVSAVTKVVCAHESVVRALLDAGATLLADSRIENLRRIRATGFDGSLMLTRLPTPSRAAETVAVADVTLVSELATMRALGGAARQRGTVNPHKGILMVDVGDLREGVWFEGAIERVREARGIPGFELCGLGCNFACFGGVIPTWENTSKLVELRAACRDELGLELPVLSGGNSSGLPLLVEGRLPAQINHYRIGEAILLGRNVIDRSPWLGTRQDAFVAVGEIVELQRKPSMPLGLRGQDAFGQQEDFEDRGTRQRAILNLGRQDVVSEGLTPLDAGAQVLGASSDHLVVDVEDVSRPLSVGSELAFYPSYSALLALSTSAYVFKTTSPG